MASPIRSCVVCRRADEKEALLRFVFVVEDGVGRAELDVRQVFDGRGLYCHPGIECFCNKRTVETFKRVFLAKGSTRKNISFKKEPLNDIIKRALKREQECYDNRFVERLERLLCDKPVEGKGPRLKLRL